MNRPTLTYNEIVMDAYMKKDLTRAIKIDYVPVIPRKPFMSEEAINDLDDLDDELKGWLE
jgi:hypothetical protein